MAKYDYYEDLEEQAYNDKITPKKKPKKQKKDWSENVPKRKFDYRKKDNKYSNTTKRI
tara:strand:+ start:459 stop:632 length:174 start_codon:yes stop_codon:yes gene_type:complete